MASSTDLPGSQSGIYYFPTA